MINSHLAVILQRHSRLSLVGRWMRPSVLLPVRQPLSSCRPLSSSSPKNIPATNIALSEMHDVKNDRRLSNLAPAPTNSSLDEDVALLQDAGIDSDYLYSLASQRPTALRLADMYKYGRGTDPAKRLRNAQFLHKELPIRIAHRAVDLLTLPHGLSEAPPIREVAAMYLKYLGSFREVPAPTNSEQEEIFTDMLQGLVLDRASIPTAIAQGVNVWSDGNHKGIEAQRLEEMDDALYRFFTARVGLRFLTEHHVLSSRPGECQSLLNVTVMFPHEEGEDYIGCIQTNVDVAKEIRKVADLVTQQTKDHYKGNMEDFRCPEVEIVDCNASQKAFTYVPHHLHYMLAELFKNSFRATIDRYHKLQKRGIEKPEVHPIRVVIAKGEEDVTIKIADRGGGIPRSATATVWQFAHSTSSDDEPTSDFGKDQVMGTRIRGFGLPLARIYARYFGGELTLKSTEGYGLDAYLYLPRLGDNCENLPLRVRASPGELDSLPLLKARNYSTSTHGPSEKLQQQKKQGGLVVGRLAGNAVHTEESAA